MSKTLLHRIFGLGRVPKKLMPILESEGIVMLEEGVGGSVTLRNFKAPGRWHSWKRSGFTGALVLTQARFAAFTFSRSIINVPFDHERFAELHCSLADASTLRVEFDVAAFHDGWRGSCDCRFRTDKAQMALDQITSRARPEAR